MALALRPRAGVRRGAEDLYSAHRCGRRQQIQGAASTFPLGGRLARNVSGCRNFGYSPMTDWSPPPPSPRACIGQHMCRTCMSQLVVTGCDKMGAGDASRRSLSGRQRSLVLPGHTDLHAVVVAAVATGCYQGGTAPPLPSCMRSTVHPRPARQVRPLRGAHGGGWRGKVLGLCVPPAASTPSTTLPHRLRSERFQAFGSMIC